jgi:hypothetical protein
MKTSLAQKDDADAKQLVNEPNPQPGPDPAITIKHTNMAHAPTAKISTPTQSLPPPIMLPQPARSQPAHITPCTAMPSILTPGKQLNTKN